MGNIYFCSLSIVQQAFRWPDLQSGEGIYEPPYGKFEPAWEIATSPYQGGDSKAISIRDPCLYYMHDLLNKTIFSWKNAYNVGRGEHRVLYLLQLGARVDWAYYFIYHLRTMLNKNPICCGGMITHFQRRRHILLVLEDQRFLLSGFLYSEWFIARRNVGTWYPPLTCRGTYFVDPDLHQPSSPRNRGGDLGQESQRCSDSRDAAKLAASYSFVSAPSPTTILLLGGRCPRWPFEPHADKF